MSTVFQLLCDEFFGAEPYYDSVWIPGLSLGGFDALLDVDCEKGFTDLRPEAREAQAYIQWLHTTVDLASGRPGDALLHNNMLLREIVRRLVKYGKQTLHDWKILHATLGPMTLVHPAEIQIFREVSEFIEMCVSSPTVAPGNILLIGEPGSGKSMSAKALLSQAYAKSLGPFLELNMTGVASEDDLDRKFGEVREVALTGRTPVLFLDEFDCNRGEEPFGWLPSLLDPLGARKFRDKEIGRSIFILAGGRFECLADLSGAYFIARSREELGAGRERPTQLGPLEALIRLFSRTYRENPTFESILAQRVGRPSEKFKEQIERNFADCDIRQDQEFFDSFFFGPGPESTNLKRRWMNTYNRWTANMEVYDGFRRNKGLDFKRRINKVVQLNGVNVIPDINVRPTRGTYVATCLKRALLLRGLLEKYPAIRRGSEILIDERLIDSFVYCDHYRHGAGSFAAIVNDSNLSGEGEIKFEPSRLPSEEQLSLHVHARSFAASYHEVDPDAPADNGVLLDLPSQQRA